MRSLLDERRQFRVLRRDFLFRIVELDLLSSRGEIQTLLVQFVALLAAFNFVVAIMRVPNFALARMAREKLLIAAWSDQEFLIATTMVVAGMFAVLGWNAFLPDRRDSLVLGPLPLRTRTICLAKVAAAAAAFAVCVAASNVFTGLTFPFLLVPPGAGPLGALRSLCAYWFAMISAGMFIVCAVLAMQGLASQLLSYRLFLRVSSFLQLAVFFLVLGVYFLKPPLATVAGLTAPENERLLNLLPSYWFLGLFQKLNASTEPVFGPLALRALWSLATVFLVAAASFALAFRRNMRHLIEQDIAPADRSRPSSRAVRFVAARFLTRPLDRAIVLFTARTIARSRQHRLLLAVYGGIALAIAAAYSAAYDGARWNQVNHPLLASGFVLLFFAVIGTRAAFALPVALPANWVFRITQVHRPAAYFAAVRKSLLIVAASPVWIAAAILYFALWPGRPALQHVALLVVAGVVLVWRALYGFRKIPFACSYLPGKANLNVKLGAYGALFLFVADLGVRFEFWTLQKPARFLVLFAILLAAARRARRRNAEFAASPYQRIQFEEIPTSDESLLDLRRDAAWSGDDAYIDAAAKAHR